MTKTWMKRGWLGGAKVSCTMRHWGFQLILAYSWARPAILVAGKGRGECFYFFCFFIFIPVPLSSLSLSFISTTISSVSFLHFSGRRHKMTYKGWGVIKPQHSQKPGWNSILIMVNSKSVEGHKQAIRILTALPCSLYTVQLCIIIWSMKSFPNSSIDWLRKKT